MTVYAVVDTNVIVSSLLTSNRDSPTIAIVESIREGRIVPLYSRYLLSEYREVLGRSKFSLPENVCEGLLSLFMQRGKHIEPTQVDVDLPDTDDAPIFLITMETRDLESYLVTGNVKHYPPLDYVVTPKRMMEILQKAKNPGD